MQTYRGLPKTYPVEMVKNKCRISYSGAHFIQRAHFAMLKHTPGTWLGPHPQESTLDIMPPVNQQGS